MARPSHRAIREHDPTYVWKTTLRLLAIHLAIIGIATTAWALTNHPQRPQTLSSDDDSNTSYNDGYYSDYGYPYTSDLISLPWTFISLGLSIIWNAINLCILASSSKWIHPGANVGMDLFLWLALLVTGIFATFGAAEYVGYYAGEYDYDGSGEGYTYSNGTSYVRSDNGTEVLRTCGGYASCGERDAWVGALQHKGVVIAVECAASFVILLIHFALFISACRYIHARKNAKYSTSQSKIITAEATEIARKMIAEMNLVPANQYYGPPQRQQQPLEHYAPMQQQQQQQPMRQPTNGPQWPLPHNGEQSSPASEAEPSYVGKGKEPAHVQGPGQSVEDGVSGESSGAAEKRGWQLPEITVESPGEVHPALRC